MHIPPPRPPVGAPPTKDQMMRLIHIDAFGDHNEILISFYDHYWPEGEFIFLDQRVIEGGITHAKILKVTRVVSEELGQHYVQLHFLGAGDVPSYIFEHAGCWRWVDDDLGVDMILSAESCAALDAILHAFEEHTPAT